MRIMSSYKITLSSIVALCLTLLAIIAFKLMPTDSKDKPNKYTVEIPKTALGRLTYYRNLWQSKNIRNYRYYFSVDCICEIRGAGVMEVIVKNGVVSSVRMTEPSPFYDQSTLPAYTMEEYFDWIEEALRDRREIDVKYRDGTGNPTLMIFKSPRGVQDGGGSTWDIVLARKMDGAGPGFKPF